jgi:hypothetical protein
VGDALWDVQAAANIGIPFVGVAQGDRGLRLRHVGATHVLDGYSDYEQLIDCLRRAGVPNDKSGMNQGATQQIIERERGGVFRNLID